MGYIIAYLLFFFIKIHMKQIGKVHFVVLIYSNLEEIASAGTYLGQDIEDLRQMIQLVLVCLYEFI